MFSIPNFKICCSKKAKIKKAFALFLLACISLSFFASCNNETKKDSNDISTNNSSKVICDFSNVQVGDYITFGHYEQDNDTANGAEGIAWLVLDIKDGKALLISKYALDAQPYDEEGGDVTWERCTLRTWLNNNFYNTAFSETEKAQIKTTTVLADPNPTYTTYAGYDTNDNVFLLSTKEASNYFSSNGKRQCQPTAYAKAQGVVTATDSSNYGNCNWWLRTPGKYHFDASYIYIAGFAVDPGYIVSASKIGIRPAIWIDLTTNC